MLTGGDEFGRSQRGNNNAFCQDNELTWFDWKLDVPRERLLKFTSQLIDLRRSHPNLHRRKFFQDRTVRGSVVHDIAWYATDGNEVSDDAWNSGWVRAIQVQLNGKTLSIIDEDGNPLVDDDFLLLVNASADGVEFTLPKSHGGEKWFQILDTQNIDDPFQRVEPDEKVILAGRSMRLFSDGTEGPQPRRPQTTRSLPRSIPQSDEARVKGNINSSRTEAPPPVWLSSHRL